MDQAPQPTWDSDIENYFTSPPWLPPEDAAHIASGWNSEMSKLFGMVLTDYDCVTSWAITIYYHLHSRSMPLTSDERQYFPDLHLETFRHWVNQGCRRSMTDQLDFADRIPAPRQRSLAPRLRKNINALTDPELLEFRLAVEALGATTYPADETVEWQRIAALHTNWCLHYQEAFLLWHRAYLLYFEALLGVPVPYWNWMSPDIANDGSPDAGLPQAFVDETFVDGEGRTRPNPLRYAIAKQGVSKACVPLPGDPSRRTTPDHIYTAAHADVSGTDCRYVHRDPVLYTSGDDSRLQRQRKLNQLLVSQVQVQHALGLSRFSPPESGGYPWANIPTFPAPDDCYTYKCDFDGRYEQPHDNYHGWVGPDMADNSYTAYDPIFWCHHSNIDRVFEGWLRGHPQTQFTSDFPLRPFVGRTELEVERADPRPFVYTNIGDMARDSRGLGYDYTPADDVAPIAPSNDERSLHIAFDGVRCTHDSYAVDVFINHPTPEPADAGQHHANYVGRMTRLGMGVEDINGRCIAHGVTRVLNADHVVGALDLTQGEPVHVSTIVTDHTTGHILHPAEVRQLPGFVPDPCWGNAVDDRRKQGNQQE